MAAEMPTGSPWLTAKQAAEYLHRGTRFVRREIEAGRLRGCFVGGRRELLTRREWLDQWVDDQTAPIAFTPRRRAL